MADNFGLKIGIEGEKEFKKALSEINQSFKVLGSEMKLVSSQFDANDKSIQALSARNTVLNKEIDAQRQKIETLRAALQNASESFGENDRRTQNWQIQLNNAEAALNGMERELSANERAIESLSRQETEAADATERLSQEISRQEEELSGMKRAYSNAVLEYGKGSSEAKELEGRISQLSGELRENRERMKDAGDVAEDFGDSLEDASSGADKLGSGLSVATVAMGNLISSGIQAALSGIQELGSAIWNLDEATEEYRVAQGKLTTAFEAAGYSGDAAQKSYTEFYKILGDTDTATEASQLLAQLAQNEQDITKWTNIAAGVYTMVPRSLAATARRSQGLHRQTCGPIPPCTQWRCASVGTECGCIPVLPTPCASRRQPAAFPGATPGTARTTPRSVNFCVWETPGPTSRMSGLMWRCRTAALKATEGSAVPTAPGMRSSRCSR